MFNETQSVNLCKKAFSTTFLYRSKGRVELGYRPL